jgi:hypothetical protein
MGWMWFVVRTSFTRIWARALPIPEFAPVITAVGMMVDGNIERLVRESSGVGCVDESSSFLLDLNKFVMCLESL